MQNESFYGLVIAIIQFFAEMVIILPIIVLQIVSMWKVFVKAKKPGWAALIPIYNILILLEITGNPWWFVFLIIFVPIANIAIVIIVMLDLAKVFGKSTAFGVGLIFLSIIFMTILAFSKDEYLGLDKKIKT